MKEDHIFRLAGKGADQDPKGVFSINKLTGEVAVSRALDREAIAFYHVSTAFEWVSYMDLEALSNIGCTDMMFSKQSGSTAS